MLASVAAREQARPFQGASNKKRAKKQRETEINEDLAQKIWNNRKNSLTLPT